MAFPSFHSRDALAVSGTGKAPPELRARSCASSPGKGSKKGLMMPHLPSLKNTDFMATLCPPNPQTHEAGNILKTKGRKRVFSQNEAGNILKKQLVTINRRNS
jgi:hypothetical protein